MSEPFFPVDELVLDAVIDWSKRRITGGEDPLAGSRPAADLDTELAGSITPEGIGGQAALERWAQIIVPATRAMGDPMNLAYVPAAPTPAALTFDLAVSSAQIMEVVLYERITHGQQPEEELEAYILWLESGELPTWEPGVSPQAIAGEFNQFVSESPEAQEMLSAEE